MKKQALIITSLAIIMLLSQTDLSKDLLLFLLVGAIPGTDYSLSSNTMLGLIIASTWLIVFRFTALRTLAAHALKTLSKYLSDIKERFLKRPLSQI